MAYCYNFPKIKASLLTFQSRKIIEEAKEVHVEVGELLLAQASNEPLTYNDIVLETLDCIQACETMLQLLVDEKAVTQGFIDNAKAEVIHKNRERGYYEEAK